MGKDKSRSKIKKGGKKKTFLDNQKRHRNDVKVTKKAKRNDVGDSEAPRKGKTFFKFQNFSKQVASVDSSIVYQLAGTVHCCGVHSVCILIQGSVRFL